MFLGGRLSQMQATDAPPRGHGQGSRDEPVVVLSYVFLQINVWPQGWPAIVELAALCQCVTCSSCVRQGIAEKFVVGRFGFRLIFQCVPGYRSQTFHSLPPGMCSTVRF